MPQEGRRRGPKPSPDSVRDLISFRARKGCTDRVLALAELKGISAPDLLRAALESYLESENPSASK